MKVAIADLQPGAMVETPEALKAMGWDGLVAIYIGGPAPEANPSFAISYNKKWQRAAWPYNNQLGRYSPLPEALEVVENKEVAAEYKKSLQRSWNMVGTYYATGTDPEFFVLNGKDEVMPARSFLPAKAPRQTMFFDGLQAEIAPLAETCLERMSVGIKNNMLGALAKARLIDPKARLTIKNSFEFKPEQMAMFSDEDVRFRCSSSLNVYDDMGELPDAREYLHRFAGGHVHIGCKTRTAPVIRAMVRSLDGILGVAGVSLARNWDSPERRRMYGRAGEFRLPKHGLEYRVLSNYWLCSPPVFHLTFELMRYAYRIGEAGAFDILYEGTEDEIRNCINHCDVALAGKLIDRNAGLYNRILGSIWSGRALTRAMETLRNGLEVACPEPDMVERNWQEMNGNYPSTWGKKFL